MATNFAKVKGENLIIEYSPEQIESVFEKLPAGVYSPDNIGGLFSKIFAFRPYEQKNKLVKFSGGVIADAVSKVTNFLDDKTKKIYTELKIAHKIGIIFYGPHGTGKTCAAHLVMNELVEKHNALCFVVTGKSLGFIESIISFIRRKQDNPIVIFIDEIDNSFSHEESRYLTFLDGENQYEQVVVLGCTNYLNEIPKRIRDRKSRIKHLFEVKSFPQEVYKEYVLDKLPNIPKDQLTEFSFLSEEEGLTLDQLKHAIIDFKLEGITIKEAIESSKKISESVEEEKF